MGFRCPNEEELVLNYLFNKVYRKPLPKSGPVIRECNLYSFEEPWEIWDKFGGKDLRADQSLYFFTPVGKMSQNSIKFDRRVGSNGGSWRGENSAVEIVSRATKKRIAFKKRFRYENNASSHNNHWLMVEYSLDPSLLRGAKLADLVLCQIRPKVPKSIVKKEKTSPRLNLVSIKDEIGAVTPVEYCDGNPVDQRKGNKRKSDIMIINLTDDGHPNRKKPRMELHQSAALPPLISASPTSSPVGNEVCLNEAEQRADYDAEEDQTPAPSQVVKEVCRNEEERRADYDAEEIDVDNAYDYEHPRYYYTEWAKDFAELLVDQSSNLPHESEIEMIPNLHCKEWMDWDLLYHSVQLVLP